MSLKELLEGAVPYPDVDEMLLYREREKRRDDFMCQFAQMLRRRGEVERAGKIHSATGPHTCVDGEVVTP